MVSSLRSSPPGLARAWWRTLWSSLFGFAQGLRPMALPQAQRLDLAWAWWTVWFRQVGRRPSWHTSNKIYTNGGVQFKSTSNVTSWHVDHKVALYFFFFLLLLLSLILSVVTHRLLASVCVKSESQLSVVFSLTKLVGWQSHWTKQSLSSYLWMFFPWWKFRNEELEPICHGWTLNLTLEEEWSRVVAQPESCSTPYSIACSTLLDRTIWSGISFKRVGDVARVPPNRSNVVAEATARVT